MRRRRDTIHHSCYWEVLLALLLVFHVSLAEDQATEPSENLDQRVQIALGDEGEGHFRSRLNAVHSLPAYLPQADAEALFRGIVAPAESQGLHPSEWAALYNDVLNVLSGLDTPLPNYTKRLFQQIGESERNEVLRDYALQHLLAYAEYHLEPAERLELLDETAELALTSTETTLPGTYLLGVYQKAGQPGYPAKDLIAEKTLSIASDSEAYVPNRISAIQICAQLDYTEALPTAMRIAKNKELRTGLRVAAIAAIGSLGNKEHNLHLQKIKYQHASDFRINHAAESALKKLQ